MIHPAAHVAAGAELGAGVEVGPGACVEAGARLGDGCIVMANAVITGAVTMGRNCRVHHGACVGGDPQDLTFDGRLTRMEIGDDVVIREGATVHRATREDAPTRVGSGCYLMSTAHVAHDCVLGERVIACNGALIAGHALIGDRAFLSGNVVVHQFSRVGTLAIISGMSGTSKDVGPYLIVSDRSQIRGINVVGLRRAGFDLAARRRVQNAYRELFGADSLAVGRDRVRGLGEEFPEIREIVEFYGATKRGFARPTPGHALESSSEEI